MKQFIYILPAALIWLACSVENDQKAMVNTFQDDIEFLRKHTEVIVLKGDHEESRIAVVPAYQGRVMTSTLNGAAGMSFGWINHEKISSGLMDERFNAYGGEDRFWLGPEGGQFSLYHKPGGEFTLDNWYVPRQIDAEPFEVTAKNENTVSMKAEFSISNYAENTFDVRVERQVKIFSNLEIIQNLHLADLDDLEAVGFESENHLYNAGDSAWEKSEGLLSIWILGMYNPGDEVVIILPYFQGGTGSLGEVVNDKYFGAVPDDRIRTGGGLVFFKGDGKYRSKIGMNWMRARDILGSYDPESQVLTIVKYNKPEDKADYVRSMWEIMENPYEGDVVNSYNDGPPEPGADPMGPFYELETSSPVKELAPGEKVTHIHQTYHIKGDEERLNRITEKLFNVKIREIRDAFSH